MQHEIEIDYVGPSRIDSGAYAWFCSCGERGEWVHEDEPFVGEASIEVTAQADEHEAASA